MYLWLFCIILYRISGNASIRSSSGLYINHIGRMCGDVHRGFGPLYGNVCLLHQTRQKDCPTQPTAKCVAPSPSLVLRSGEDRLNALNVKPMF